MNSVFIIKRDVDSDGKTVHPVSAFWCGNLGGGWNWSGNAQKYATRKNAEAAMKRNAKYDYTFRRGFAYIAEIEVMP